MTMADPFAAPAATEEPPFEPDTVAQAPVDTFQEAPITVTQDRPTSAAPTLEAPIVTTLKGGAGFEAPWLVLRATTVAEADAMLDDALKSYMQKVQLYANGFASLAPAKPAGGGGGGQRSGGGAPAASQEAPNGEERFCSHGKMTYRSGVSKAGKAYKMFACPERDRSQQCDPQWLR
ncbi:hypothetical protein SEA_STROSAHL_54 [Gordonia phage Strosahl]|uniref:Uncharacterized protein n=2 Tax=Soupsvirus strosahl TaxID=2560510 RepID=A0A1B3B179_9CAUD|nr:ribonucleoside reductase class II [Gordonia phage Remus]YP_009596255.1 ribonucleoside reductase class II [Gordonia phage Strosahl]AOE44664.1 hypothetical protein SEA_REMUS_54 [Gordonia phage Remus]AOE44765.1 hypothetical protein SEA_STROSAHL_54 [Gordonia phage Strosahl]